MINPSITVIIPVYNVARYMERCARSLFEQSLDHIEFLFVNDCTPDASVEILERVMAEYGTKLKEKGSVVRIITMPSNSGQAVVLKRGILEATGDYMILCDGDDWVDTNLYEKMYNEAVSSGADVVSCGAVYEYAGRYVAHNVKPATYNCKDLMRNWYRNCRGMFCWNKLVRRSIYTDNNLLPWEGLNMWEDNGLMSRVFYYAGRMSVIDGPCYHYNRANVGAITVGYGQKQVRQMIGIARYLTEFFESKPDAADFRKTVMAFQFLAKINLITDSFSRIREYRTMFPGSEAIASELDRSAFSAKGRFRFNMVKLRLAWLFVLMFKVKNLVLLCHETGKR